MATANLDFDQLAAGMHAGWLAYMRAEGYQRGEERCDERRTHPDLRPYKELSTASRDRERGIAAELLSALDSAGYAVSSMDSASESGLTSSEAHDRLGQLLTMAAFEAWLGQTQPGDRVSLTEAAWLDATTAHKRAQDLAAVNGLLDTVYGLDLVVVTKQKRRE